MRYYLQGQLSTELDARWFVQVGCRDETLESQVVEWWRRNDGGISDEVGGAHVYVNLLHMHVCACEGKA